MKTVLIGSIFILISIPSSFLIGMLSENMSTGMCLSSLTYALDDASTKTEDINELRDLFKEIVENDQDYETLCVNILNIVYEHNEKS